jgi:hypothetical protein
MRQGVISEKSQIRRTKDPITIQSTKWKIKLNIFLSLQNTKRYFISPKLLITVNFYHNICPFVFFKKLVQYAKYQINNASNNFDDEVIHKQKNVYKIFK